MRSTIVNGKYFIAKVDQQLTLTAHPHLHKDRTSVVRAIFCVQDASDRDVITNTIALNGLEYSVTNT
jgi:hypothetical protein